jgi:hypothetical protein
MYGDGPLASAPIAAFAETVALIIPEVGVETKQLVFVVEIDLLQPAPSS